MNEEIFKRRTKQLALRVIQVAESLPKTQTSSVISKQIIRSATSVGANYRSVCRAKSTADMISKLGTVLEEADETLYWLELLVEAKIIPHPKLANLMSETNEIIAMLCSSIKTLRKKPPTPKI